MERICSLVFLIEMCKCACRRRRRRERENTCKTLKFVFGRWSDVVIDAGHSDEVSIEAALHFRSVAAAL